MFFPSPTGIINRTLSRIESQKNRKKGKSYSESEPILSLEDLLRKTYGDGNKQYLSKSVSELRKSKPVKIVKGKKLEGGFRQFLSNYGKTTHLVRFKEGVPQDEPVDFDFLEGKTLVICCFKVPLYSTCAGRCRAVIEAFKNSFTKSQELVVVAYMETKLDYDLKVAFDQFYSAFSCLAIPFTDFDTRDYIYSCMSNPTLYQTQNLAMMVSPQGVIMHDDQLLDHYYYLSCPSVTSGIPEEYDDHLRSAFDPIYASEDLASISYDLLWHTCPPLNLRILYPFLSPYFDAGTLMLRKYVGLYLCVNGSIMEDIKAAHDHCLANHQQLEILVVPLPFHDEPTVYMKDLHLALKRLNINSWFIHPYNSTHCRTLWRIFGRGSAWVGEKFVIVPPHFKSGELCGREIITNFGVDQYPFTRTAILKRRLKHLESLTPLFSTVFKNCLMIQKGKPFKSDELQGKNVLLYIGLSESAGLYGLLKKHYHKIKAAGWEVVFVLLKCEQRVWNGEIVERDYSDSLLSPRLEMPWPWMRLSADAQASIKEKLIFPEDFKTRFLFAVSKNGKIVSRDVEHGLDTLGVTEALFKDVLERDLVYRLARIPLVDDCH